MHLRDRVLNSKAISWFINETEGGALVGLGWNPVNYPHLCQ